MRPSGAPMAARSTKPPAKKRAMRLATKVLVVLIIANEIRGVVMVAGFLWAWFK